MSNLQYYLLYSFCFCISLLPYRVLYFISDVILYPILYHIIRYRRTVVEEGMKISFPEKSKEELASIERKFYHFFCDYIFETIKLVTVSKEELKKRMIMKGTEEMYNTFDTNTMLFVYLGHFCNWEYIASLQWWMPDDVVCSQIYSTLRNDAFDRLFFKIRSRFGGINIEKNHSLRIIMEQKRKKAKTVVGFIADQGPRWINIHLFTPFLHHDTPVFTGTERIARKVNASVFIANVTRPQRGYYVCSFEPITLNVNADFTENKLTETYMQKLEKQIIANPHLWLWTHRRWRRQRTDADAPAEWKATIQGGKIISNIPVEVEKKSSEVTATES